MPLDYNGEISKSAIGTTCKYWSDAPNTFPYPTDIQGSRNYCRATTKVPNADGKKDHGAWCWVSATEWEYCVCPGTCTNNLKGYLPVTPDTEMDYTVSGYRCESWAGKSMEYGAPIDTSHNFCRKTHDDDKGAWCWSSNPTVDLGWEYCRCHVSSQLPAQGSQPGDTPWQPAPHNGGLGLGGGQGPAGQDFTDDSTGEDIFSVSDKDTTSCPSEECWNYDSSTKQCELIDGCSTVTCTGTTMTITMNRDVFGRSVGSSEIFMTIYRLPNSIMN